MKLSSLQALIIDRHCGELSPEAADLLDHHLSLHADARAEADRILESLTVTQKVMVQHPEIGHVMPAARSEAAKKDPRHTLPSWLARAAAIALFTGLSGAGGYMTGRSSSTASPVSPALAVNTPRKASPWTQYRMAFDAGSGKLQPVRVDASTSNP